MGVNKERVELWAQALESEQYVQCYGHLRNGLNHRCAVGVAIEVALRNGHQFSGYGERDECGMVTAIWCGDFLPRSITSWYGFDLPDPLLNMEYQDKRPLRTTMVNDNLRLPFWDIAQAIRATYLKDE